MNSPINTYTVILTEDCNLRCSYCYVKKDPNVMNIETASKVMDYIFANTEKYGDSKIDMFGGEPLMNMDVVYYIIDRCAIFNKTHKQEIIVMIFTNGTLMTRELLEYTSNHNFVSFNLSQDGCEQCHNTTRKYANGLGSFKDIIAGNKLYKAIYGSELIPKFMLSPDNMEYLPDTIQYMLDNNMERMSISVIRDDVWNAEDIIRLEKILSAAAQMYMDNVDKLWIDLFTIPIIDYGYTSTSYCSAGKNMVGISPDGGIYPCQRFYNNSKDKFKIGDVVNGIDYDSITYCMFSNYTVERQFTKCKKCDVFKSCNCVGQCMAACYEANGSVFSAVHNVCNVLKLVYLISKDIHDKMQNNPFYIEKVDMGRYGG